MLAVFFNLSFYIVDGDGEASAKSFYGYPTVNSGPMDISKAKDLLGFSPTTTAEAVRQTVHFYEEAFYAFPNQRDEVLSELFTSAIPKVCSDCTDKKRKLNFPHVLGNSNVSGCRVIYEDGLPNI